MPTTGRPRTNDMPEVLNAIFYINRSGCQWDMLPHDLPAKSSVYRHFAQWRDDGTWRTIMDSLARAVRTEAQKDPSPSAASIDSQTVKGTEVAGLRGYDGGKKLTGVKRHIVADTLGLVMVVSVSAASADDGTYAPQVLARLSVEQRVRLGVIWANGKYRNHQLEGWVSSTGAGYKMEVIGRPEGGVGFVKLPRRWVVERTLAWVGRYRRNSRHYEWHARSGESMIRISSVHRMLVFLRTDESIKANPFKYRESKAKLAG